MKEIDLSNWKFCKKIQTNPEKVAGNQIFKDFVVLLPYESMDLVKYARKDLNDVIFVNEDHSEVLHHQIKQWDSSKGSLKVNLLLPILHANKPTTVYIYYGNLSHDYKRDNTQVWKNYLDQRTFTNEIQSVDSTDSKGGFMDFKKYQNLHKELLEDLFGKQWFTKNVNRKKIDHPAYGEWLLCQKDFKDFSFSETISMMRLQSKNYSLISISKGKIASLSLGELSNYGDEDVVARIKNTIVDHNQYHSTFSEISYASSLLRKNISLTATEEKGLPDFKINCLENNGVSVEVKRLLRDSSNEALRRAISKANIQHKTYIKLKNRGETIPALTVIYFDQDIIEPTTITDEFPEDIAEKIKYIERLLSGSYSTTSCVTVSWNDCLSLGHNDDSSTKVLINLRKISHSIRNKKSISEILQDASYLEISEAVQFFINKN